MKRKRLRRYVLILRNILCLFLITLLFFLCQIKKLHYDQIRSRLFKSTIKFIEFEEHNYANTLQIDMIRRLIGKYNREERILNLDIYGEVEADAAVLVIFVDKYKTNLKFLLASLQHVTGIADALIIFSHSQFDENVNALIKRIDFARVAQIYYPYTLQVYHDEFPGFQSGDCTRGMSITTAEYLNCTGAYTPDIHGRYRDPALAQKKHYWWWTMNHVFEKFTHTKNHKGIFIFLDDDVFLMEDLIYMALQMKSISKFIFQCDFVSLDTGEEPDFFQTKTYGADISTWDPRQHSSVLAFDYNVWNSIAAHYYLFCNFDDYSWSRSLFYLSLNRKDGNRFRVISSTMPRAYKTCRPSGTYEFFVEYNIVETVYNILQMQKRNLGNLFPAQLEVFLNIELDYDDFVTFDYVDNNGGWSDPRDRKMCNDMTVNKVKKIILEMDKEFHQYSNVEEEHKMFI